ncbi:MAG: hypothetical protein ACRDJO_10370 [Actinomycetota bacterium]
MTCMTLAELEAHDIDVLPVRNTMGLVDIGTLTALNGLNVLNNNNIDVIANVIADGNSNKSEQHNSSNDLITCIVGLAFDGDDSCHE